MRKSLTLTILMMMGLSACSVNQQETLKVFNWGVYIDEDLKEAFEEEYKCVVIYDTFDSNESMYTKIQSGEKYDVLYPSDYMVDRLIQEHYLQALNDQTKSDLAKVLPTLLHQVYDPENLYSVPYFFGNVGLLYNQTKVSPEDLNAGWNILQNTKYQGDVYFYDSERDAFMVALKALGYSTNTKDATQINEAFEWLKQLNSTMSAVYVTDDVIDNMIAGNKSIAVVYSGDAAYILQENENMAYFVPEEGTNIWIDSMVIPNNAPNAVLANAWIQFMMRHDSMVANTLEVGYTTVRSDVYQEMITQDFAENLAYQVRMDNPKDEVFIYDEELKVLLSDLWVKVKAQ